MSEINPALRDHLNMLAAKAAKGGADVWDVLNAAGLIFTEDLRRQHRAHALRTTLELLEARSVPQLIGPAYAEGRSTAKDMRRGITEFLTERVELAKVGQA
jgi:hypothetical protein